MKQETQDSRADETPNDVEAEARRTLLLGMWDMARATPIGALSALLVTACGGGGGTKTTTTTDSLTPPIDPACAAMTMPGGGTPAPLCAGGPPGTGTTVPPGTGTTVPPGTGTPSTTSRTFTFLGPNTASVTASMGAMMTPMSIATSVGRVRVWVLNGAATGFNNDRVVPGPVIELAQGQPAAITLTNMSMASHTIHPHGLDVDTLNDGVPATSFAVPPMGSNTYRFTAPFAGTYFYHCHVDAALHAEMGMYGAVIVRPPSGAINVAWDGGPAFDREYLWQMSTFDSRWHTATQTGPATMRYRPNVFLLNGRDGAGPAADSATAISAPQGARVLLRLINYGYMPASVNLGGITFDVIASDGRPLKSAIAGQTTWAILPGERYDLLITMPAAGARPVTVSYQNIRGTTIVGTAQTTVTST